MLAMLIVAEPCLLNGLHLRGCSRGCMMLATCRQSLGSVLASDHHETESNVGASQVGG